MGQGAIEGNQKDRKIRDMEDKLCQERKRWGGDIRTLKGEIKREIRKLILHKSSDSAIPASKEKQYGPKTPHWTSKEKEVPQTLFSVADTLSIYETGKLLYIEEGSSAKRKKGEKKGRHNAHQG